MMKSLKKEIILLIILGIIIFFFLKNGSLKEYLIFVAVIILLILFAKLISKSDFEKVWGGFWGLIIGFILGKLFYYGTQDIFYEFKRELSLIFNIFMPVLGVYFGVSSFYMFKPSFIKTVLKGGEAGVQPKILDTSVIIDGRIVDICETGFLEGKVIVPIFIINELQKVADSEDDVKRQRGRRGFDLLEKLKKCPAIDFEILDRDYDINEADLKLIQLAREIEGKIVTNDYNLNKLAKIQGIKILNINELANALRPVVLPGEKLRVYILKEGKEKDQGVAYLDDGTMVVVDNARKMIGQTVEITVTSVLQTVAGKMIFGRYE